MVYTLGLQAQRTSQQSSSGFSSRSAMDFGTRAQISSRGASAGMMYHQDDMVGMGGMSTMGGGYQSSQTRYQTSLPQMSRPISRGLPDPETMSLRSQQIQQHPMQQQTWIARNGSEGSVGSDQENNFTRQEAAYTMSNGFANSFPQQAMYSTSNEFQSGITRMTMPPMRTSYSSSLPRNGGGMNMEENMVRQSYKGPSQRTISKINQNRQSRYSVSAGSLQGGTMGGSYAMGGAGSQNNLTMMMGRMSRAPSMRSVVSVGRGRDVFDGDFTEISG